MDITREKLLAFGFVDTGDPVVLARKPISNRNPLNTSEDTSIELIIHKYFNQEAFAVAFPDGGILNFIANSMVELEAFESAISFYDPNF